MIKPSTSLSTQVTVSGSYPYGGARDATVSNDTAATPFTPQIVNDLWGFFQSCAAVNSSQPNGDPDSVYNPQLLRLWQYYFTHTLQAKVIPGRRSNMSDLDGIGTGRLCKVPLDMGSLPIVLDSSGRICAQDSSGNDKPLVIQLVPPYNNRFLNSVVVLARNMNVTTTTPRVITLRLYKISVTASPRSSSQGTPPNTVEVTDAESYSVELVTSVSGSVATGEFSNATTQAGVTCILDMPFPQFMDSTNKYVLEVWTQGDFGWEINDIQCEFTEALAPLGLL